MKIERIPRSFIKDLQGLKRPKENIGPFRQGSGTGGRN
jgi:hypothetical protein